MADSIVSSSKITAVANAIRTKAGTQSTMTLDEMPTAIANIPGGGGGNTPLAGYTGRNWSCAVAPHVDTTGMTDMSRMFSAQGVGISTLDLTHFNTSDVTNMEYMFYQNKVSSLDIRGWDVSKVTNMQRMFNEANISSLTLDFSASNVTSMNQMFLEFGGTLSSPVVLDLSSFRTSNVLRMNQMFQNAHLSSLDLDNWNTSNVTNMFYMFTNSFKSGGKMWVPSTFVATGCATGNKPFENASRSQVQVYTDATDATTQGWGTIHANFVMHYNSTHQDFLNA